MYLNRSSHLESGQASFQIVSCGFLLYLLLLFLRDGRLDSRRICNLVFEPNLPQNAIVYVICLLINIIHSHLHGIIYRFLIELSFH